MRNSRHTTPADRMAKLIAAARSDDDAKTGSTHADQADEVPGTEVPAGPTRTGGWIPQLEPDSERERSLVPGWLASRLPKSPRLGIAMGAGVIVAAIMLVAGGIFAVRFAIAAPAVHPIAESASPAAPRVTESEAAANPSFAAGAGTEPSTAPPSSGGSRVTVQVVGAVRKPGVVQLKSGARVVDAVKAAGGASGRADTAAVNMARRVVDGEQILVPRIGETPSPDPPPAQPPAAPDAPSVPGIGAPGSATPGAAPVNLNTADDAELETLPNIGPVTAQKIIDWRTANNGFSTVEDLLDVPGIGPKTFEQLKDLVTV